jgi:hypothetical protein
MTYKYPNFELWYKSLTPIEMAFVILYTAGKDPSFSDIVITEKPDNVEIDDAEDSGSFTWEATPPVNPNTHEYGAVNLEFSWSGGYYGGSSGTYWDPPEPSTDYISSFEVDQLNVYDADGDDVKIDDSTVNALQMGFTYQNMLDLATSIGMDFAEVEEFNDTDAEKCVSRVAGRKHQTKRHVRRVRDVEREELEKKNDPDKHHTYFKDEVRIEEIPAIPGLNFPDKLKHKIEEILRTKSYIVNNAAKKYGL